MDANSVKKILSKKRQAYNEVSVVDSLSKPVDESTIYELIDSIKSIRKFDETTVTVEYRTPFHGASSLTGEYTYSVTVSEDSIPDIESNSRCSMPRDKLISLHQLTIIIWSMQTGQIYDI